MRKLASIQRITALDPIPGKDRIVRATVLGWSVIVQKADFKVGDLCVFIEPDSVLPEIPEFEFLRSKNFRIKTMKMAGVLSQGICFPTSILTFKDDLSPYTMEWTEGEDVTKILNIHQYEPEMDDDKYVANQPGEKKPKNPLMRFKFYRKIYNYFHPKTKGSFPDFLEKTDETRIQTAPWMLEDEEEYIATEKVDGCSGTFALVHHKILWFDKYEYIVCSRNLRLNARDNSIYWQVSDKYKIEQALRNMIGKRAWIAIQGECVGPKIQGNKYKVTEPALYVFNVIDPQQRMNSVQAKNLMATRGIDFVPIVDEHFKLPKTVEEMLDIATAQSQLGDTLREGLVVRSKNGKKSFKAVSPDFLIKYS